VKSANKEPLRSGRGFAAALFDEGLHKSLAAARPHSPARARRTLTRRIQVARARW
jgi:hypothetical protein